MQPITEAIVLHLAKYTDKAAILHTYTKESGRIQYILYNSQRKNAGYGTFAPLSHIEIETGNTRNNSMMPRLNNARLVYVPTYMHTDMTRRSIALFIAEILYRTLRHPLPDNNLFDFLTELITRLDTAPSTENLHLLFLFRFTEYLGIMPDLEPAHSKTSSSAIEYLDMQTGCLTASKPPHTDCFTPTETQLLQSLLQHRSVYINRHTRQSILTKLVRYYAIHLPDFQSPKTLDILTQVFD